MTLGPSADRPPSKGGLTSLDRRILDALPDRQGVAVSALVAELNRGKDRWNRARTDDDEVLGILRGFEHLEQAACSRRGLWRRMERMDPERTE